MGETDQGSRMQNRRTYDPHHGLVLEYLLSLIASTGRFYQTHDAFFREYQTFGVRPRQSVESADAESILFFAHLLSQAKNDVLKKNLLEHITTGRLQLNRLKDLHERFYGRSDGSGSKESRVAIDRIVVFVWKVLGFSNQEIADRTGLKKKTVRNHITQIYEVIIPDSEKLPPQRRHALLVKKAVEGGFIYSQS